MYDITDEQLLDLKRVFNVSSESYVDKTRVKKWIEKFMVENFTKDDLRQIVDANHGYIGPEEVFYQDELSRWADRNCPSCQWPAY